MKGKIIVIEGTDGSGKQTQVEELYKFFKEQGLNVQKQSFPNYESASAGPVKMYLGGELSKTANEISAEQASILFAVDRFCTMKKYENFLNNGGILLLDRYMESNLIHQIGKIPNTEKKAEFAKWLCDLEYNKMQIPKPNLVIFLNMPPEYSLKLASQRDSFKSGTKKDIHEQDQNHIKLAYKNGMSVANQRKWQIIDCVENEEILSIEKIQTKIRNTVQKNLNLTKEQKNEQNLSK